MSGRRCALPALRRLLAATALVAGAVALLSPAQPPAEPSPTPVAAAAADRAADRAADPVRLRIPAIGVDTPLARLGVDATGALVPPAAFDEAGWYTGAATPGDVGPAVLAGHVDSRSGPAVFWRLGDLRPGDAVQVDRADGTAVHFTVTRTARSPKTGFPTEAVYAPTPRAELRLVTCGGDFDRSARSYTDNVVVFAQAT
ncbi:class F sortase [Geodermatophilus sp. SYSU D00697]